ncbi:unnamed protein product [Symbiodinium sp. KB8]|nr:unnamed protein product [Symbiodinium sp. KB8]
MTATFLALSAPKSTVTAVDIRPPQHLPHFHEAGIANVRYLCEDMTRPGFLEVMEKALLDVALPAIVLGMHCCGALSVVATQIYNRFPQCVAILLCPCCLLRNIDVKRADSLMPEVPKSLLSLSEARPEERYERWAHGLAQLLPEASVLGHDEGAWQLYVGLLVHLRCAVVEYQDLWSACSGSSQVLQGLKISGVPETKSAAFVGSLKASSVSCRHVLQSRINELRERPILPMLVIDSMLPGQRLVFNSPNKELQVLVEEEQDIGVIGMVRSRFGTSPARHGVSATLKQVNFNQWELKALRHFKVLGPAEHDGDITRAKVEWVNDETSEEDVKLAETLVPLVDEWTATLMEMGKERYDGQLADILKDLGDMPEAKAPGQLAIWVAALVNPIPALGVAYEIRPAVLSASSVRERLEVAIEGIRGSIDHISGKRKLF